MKRTLPNSFHEATVTMMPKPHKDSTKKENYRPIFLMNIDEKYSNTGKLNPKTHIKKIIPHNQVDFILLMQRQYNIQKSVHVIHHINKMKEEKHDHLI